MGVDIGLLKEQCARTIERTAFQNLGERLEAKVRDSYVQAEEGLRLIVVSDRVSTFDVIVGTLPFKGQVLNQLAAFWLERSRSLAPNHLLEVPDPNVSVVRECRVLPVEFVFRGYLTGSSNTSIWRAYEGGARVYCGHRLADGMKQHERLAAPLLTPTTKAELGEHDQLTSREELVASGVISEELYDRAAALGRRIFDAGVDWAAQQGLILVDTKYEMGLSPDGELMLVDEIHTPDSSRYWWSHGYDRAMSEGRDPEPLDKEYLRRWMIERGYRGAGSPPSIPDEVRCEAARRYIETFEAVTGRAFEPSTDEPIQRIERNLARFFRSGS